MTPMNRLKFWRISSKVFGYGCGVLVIAHTFFLDDVPLYSVFTLVEFLVLILFLLSELMILLFKWKKRNAKSKMM